MRGENGDESFGGLPLFPCFGRPTAGIGMFCHFGGAQGFDLPEYGKSLVGIARKSGVTRWAGRNSAGRRIHPMDGEYRLCKYDFRGIMRQERS